MLAQRTHHYFMLVLAQCWQDRGNTSGAGANVMSAAVSGGVPATGYVRDRTVKVIAGM
jgi:hypothetical protein